MASDYGHLMDLIKTDKELVLPGDKRLELKKGGKAWRRREREKKEAIDKILERSHNRKQSQMKYYKKNKEELNRKRALRNLNPEYCYYRAKKRCEYKDLEWGFTLLSWVEMWDSAPKVVHPRTGFLVPAWSMRGSNIAVNTQMVRLDPDKGWTPENCAIAYRGEVLDYGRRDSIERPRADGSGDAEG